MATFLLHWQPLCFQRSLTSSMEEILPSVSAPASASRRARTRSVCPDKELVAACVAGDKKAHHQLFSLYQRRVFSVVLRIAGAEDAEEVTQEAFIRIFRGLKRFRGDSKLSTWVYRLSVNAALTHVTRRRRPNAGGEALEKIAAPEAPRRDPKLSSALSIAMGKLPAGYRAVLVLHDIQGLSHEECAAVLGCRTGTSKSQLHKARAKMREILGPDYSPSSSSSSRVLAAKSK